MANLKNMLRNVMENKIINSVGNLRTRSPRFQQVENALQGPRFLWKPKAQDVVDRTALKVVSGAKKMRLIPEEVANAYLGGIQRSRSGNFVGNWANAQEGNKKKLSMRVFPASKATLDELHGGWINANREAGPIRYNAAQEKKVREAAVKYKNFLRYGAGKARSAAKVGAGAGAGIAAMYAYGNNQQPVQQTASRGSLGGLGKRMSGSLQKKGLTAHVLGEMKYQLRKIPGEISRNVRNVRTANPREMLTGVPQRLKRVAEYVAGPRTRPEQMMDISDMRGKYSNDSRNASFAFSNARNNISRLSHAIVSDLNYLPEQLLANKEDSLFGLVKPSKMRDAGFQLLRAHRAIKDNPKTAAKIAVSVLAAELARRASQRKEKSTSNSGSGMKKRYY
jgi:hypothetical protein